MFQKLGLKAFYSHFQVTRSNDVTSGLLRGPWGHLRFFKAGEVVATRRSSIKHKNVDMTLFLNENLLCFGTVQ